MVSTSTVNQCDSLKPITKTWNIECFNMSTWAVPAMRAWKTICLVTLLVTGCHIIVVFHCHRYCIDSNALRSFFPEIWHSNMLGHLKFVYEVLSRTMPNWIILNQTMQNQTKACIATSCEICALLGYYVA